MSSSLPTLESVAYVDPWAPTPAATGVTGVVVTTPKDKVPTGYVLAVQLLQGGSPLASEVAKTDARALAVVPPAPLSDCLPYSVEVQWVTGPPVDWSDPATIASAPVVTGVVRLTGGTVYAAGASLGWDAAGVAPGAAAQIDQANPLFLAETMPAKAGQTGRIDFIHFTPAADKTYAVYLRAARPISESANDGFAPPYSYGPWSAPAALPTAGPVISGVSFDGESLTVDWASVALSPPEAAEIEYLLHLLGPDPRGELARSHAGSTGGQISLQTHVTSGLRVAGSVRFDAVYGPRGAPQHVITAAPAVTTLEVVPSSTPGRSQVTVTLDPPPPVPAGVAATIRLLQDGTEIASAVNAANPPTATFDIAMPAGHRYEVQGRFGVSTTPVLTGPLGPASPVLVPAPAIATAAYDGTRIALGWQGGPQAGVVAHTVTLTPATGNPIVLRTGPEQLLDTDVFLDLSTTWTATVQPVGARSAGLTSAAAAIALPTVTAPVVRTVSYDGEMLTVEWDSAKLPALSGYTVTLAGGVAMTLGVGTDTTLSVPLAPAQAVGTTVTATGMSANRSTAASVAVPVVSAVPAISAVSAGTSVSVTWAITDPPSGASYVAELLDGDAVVQRVAGNATGASFTTPPTAPGRYSVRGRVELATGSGPDGAAVPVLPLAPTILFGAILDDVLTLQWTPAPGAGATGYAVTYGKTGGTAALAATAGTQLVVPIAGQDLTPGTASVAAAGPRTAGPAATVSIVDGYSVQSATYDGSALSVTLGGTLSPAPTLLWVDVVVDGRVAARATQAGAPAGAIAVPVALRPGSPAAIRATGVGTGPLTPPSAQVALPTTAPAGVAAVYDGTSLHVTWDPVVEAGLTGYQVTVAGATSTVGPTYVAGAGASSATIAAQFTQPIPTGSAVTVRAVNQVSQGNLVLGPASAAAVPTPSTYGRAFAIPAASQPPYVYRHGQYQTRESISGADIEVYVPNPFAQGTPSVAHAGVNTYFSLAPVAGKPYLLTIDKSIWTSFGQYAVRSEVRTAYRTFLKSVEALGVLPWAIPKLRQLIAEVMPQTFAETLYYRYGAWRGPSRTLGNNPSDGTLRAVDLEPGLRLRVSGALWQLVTGTAPNPLNGFVAAGEETLELSVTVPPDSAGTGIDPTSRSLSVDAFLSLMLPGASVASSNVAAGPLDFFRGNRQTYYRLFYPAGFTGSGSTPSAQITDNVAIVGAPTWQALETVTDQFATNGFVLPNNNVFATYFRGRDALTPLLSASVCGDWRWVPVGTTVRQMLASVGLAIWPGGGAGGYVELSRPVSSVVDPSFGDPLLWYEPVDMSDAPIAASSPPLWPLDLPVLGGDEIAAGPGASGA